jgi:hypothetical protein
VTELVETTVAVDAAAVVVATPNAVSAAIAMSATAVATSLPMTIPP